MKITHFIALLLLFFSSHSYGDTNRSQVLNEWQQMLIESKEDGLIKDIDVSPMAIVAITDDGKKADADLINQIISVASQVFPRQVTVCDICLGDEVRPDSGLYYRFGQITLSDVKNHYKELENKPRSALWVQLEGERLSFRIVSLKSDRVIFSANVDPSVDWQARSMQNFSTARMQQRLARRHEVTHHQWNMGLYPSFALSYNYLNQWGERNEILSGLGISIVSPELAVGFSAFKVIHSKFNPLIGGSILINLPQAINNSLGGSGDNDPAGEDSLIIVQFIYKQPMPGNFGSLMALGLVDTSGTISLGVAW